MGGSKKKEAKGENVHVVVRIRPLSVDESNAGSEEVMHFNLCDRKVCIGSASHVRVASPSLSRPLPLRSFYISAPYAAMPLRSLV